MAKMTQYLIREEISIYSSSKVNSSLLHKCLGGGGAFLFLFCGLVFLFIWWVYVKAYWNCKNICTKSQTAMPTRNAE